MGDPSHLDTIGPDHHAEMEAHYAAGMERQDEQHLFDIAFAEAKARVDAEIEREGFPPSAQILVAWGVGAGVRAATSRLMREIGDAREEMSRMKCEMSRKEAEGVRFGGSGVKEIRGSRADIDLVQSWHTGMIRAEYLAERNRLYINEAQRLAALVRSLGGDPEPEKKP